MRRTIHLLQVIRIDNTEKPCPPLNKVGNEYHNELREEPVREGLRPISVTQPQGASFKVDFSSSLSFVEFAMTLLFITRALNRVAVECNLETEKAEPYFAYLLMTHTPSIHGQ